MGLHCTPPVVKDLRLMTSSCGYFLAKFLSISLIYPTLNIPTRGPDNAVQASLTWKPVDTFIQIGGSAELSCRTDLTESINWQQRKLADGRSHVLYTNHILLDYDGRKNSDRMNVTPGSLLGGWYNLTIKNISYNDAGVYTCVDDDAVEGAEMFSVQLIVIGGHGLQCSHNLDICARNSHPVTVVEITCSLEYCGNIPPVLVWKKSGTVITEATFVHTFNSTNSTAANVTSIVVVMGSSQLINSSPLRCEIVLTKFCQHCLSSASIGSLGFVYHTPTDSSACLPVYNETCSTNPADLKCSSGSFYWPNDNNALQFDLKVYEADERIVTDVYYCMQGNIACNSTGSDAGQETVDATVLVPVLVVIGLLLLMVLLLFVWSKRNQICRQSSKTTITEALPGNSLIIIGLVETGSNRISKDVYCVSLEEPTTVTEMNALPFEMNFGAVASVSDKFLYITGLGEILRQTFRLDLLSGVWFKCKDMKTGRKDHCMATMGSGNSAQLFVLGGVPANCGMVLSSVECYNVAKNEWSSAGYLCHAVFSGASVRYKNFIYVFGGGNEHEDMLSHIQVYDMTSGDTEIEEPMPRSFRCLHALLWKTSIILLHYDTCLVYNIETKTWLEKEEVKTSVVDCAIGYNNDMIFVVGGAATDGQPRYTFRGVNLGSDTDEIKSVPVSDIIEERPAFWKLHCAKLPYKKAVGTFVTLFSGAGYPKR